MDAAGHPRVTVGMPVYNGEAFVAEAIEAVLAQDFRDLELVISDNASTDSTLDICQEHAARDPRVRLLHSPVNRGLAWNFNHVFHACDSELFMWNAADDVRRPAMVGRCVAALDAAPDAVLAYTRTQYIDASGRLLRTWPTTGGAAAGPPGARFGDVVLRESQCFPAHGVVRRSALVGTALHGGYPSSDKALLAELALRGRFVELDEPLVLRRDHPDRSMRRFAGPREREALFDPSRAGKITLPRWRLGAEYGRAVVRAPLPPVERVRALGYLAPWTLKHRRALTRQVASAARTLVLRSLSGGGMPGISPARPATEPRRRPTAH